jgi:hypothetical protein
MSIKSLCLATLYLTLALGAGAVSFSVFQLVEDLDEQVIQNGPELQRALAGVTLATQGVNSAVGTFNDVAAAQKANVTRTSLEAAKTGAAARLLIDRLDKQLNDHTLPNLDAQVSSLGSMGTVSLAKLGYAADSLNAASVSLDKAVSDPNIGISIQQISLASTQAAQASVHANKVLDDTQKVTDHYAYEILKPVNFAHRVGEFILDHALDAGLLYEGAR